MALYMSISVGNSLTICPDFIAVNVYFSGIVVDYCFEDFIQFINLKYSSDKDV